MSEILVGVDSTEGAQDALVFARRLAALTGARLRLANAFPYSDMPSRASNDAFRQALEADAKTMLEQTDVGDAPKHAIADVSPPRALHQLAEETDASLVVVGSTRRGPIGRVFPGSTAERLLHGSPCPVAIVPAGYGSAERELKVIGVAYDGSEESEAALVTASELARRVGATLRMIRIFDTGQIGTPALVSGPGYYSEPREAERTCREHFDRRVDEQPKEIEVEAMFYAGIPHKELAEQSQGVDLMVVGSRGYGPRRAVLLGGVSHSLVRKAACPVIILPRGAKASLAGLFAPAAEATA
jgi:nucleotide-binding universal stress UspA family protein